MSKTPATVNVVQKPAQLWVTATHPAATAPLVQLFDLPDGRATDERVNLAMSIIEGWATRCEELEAEDLAATVSAATPAAEVVPVPAPEPATDPTVELFG